MLLRFQNLSRFDLSQRTLTADDAQQLLGDVRDLIWNSAAACLLTSGAVWQVVAVQNHYLAEMTRQRTSG